MIPYLGCEHAREMLQPFVDGELTLAEQVVLESHLRWCRTCGAHLEDLRLIGDSIRLRVAGAPSETDGQELAGLQAGVLSRIRAERDQSFGVQVRELFDDLHLFWAGLGAVTAVTVCLFGAMGVLHAASDERPDSLAGVISTLANPGSDRNPVRLDARIQVPRGMADAPALDEIRSDEAVFALQAIVTREGRIADYELLLSERDGSRLRSTAAQVSEVSALLDAVSRSRFAPAQGVGGTPVAVNMVWLLARTTVKGTPRTQLDFETPSWRTPERAIPAAPLDAKPLTPNSTSPISPDAPGPSPTV